MADSEVEALQQALTLWRYLLAKRYARGKTARDRNADRARILVSRAHIHYGISRA